MPSIYLSGFLFPFRTRWHNFTKTSTPILSLLLSFLYSLQMVRPAALPNFIFFTALIVSTQVILCIGPNTIWSQLFSFMIFFICCFHILFLSKSLKSNLPSMSQMHFLPLTFFPSLFDILRNLKNLMRTFRKSLNFFLSFHSHCSCQYFLCFIRMAFYLILLSSFLWLHSVLNFSFVLAITLRTSSFHHLVSSLFFCFDFLPPISSDAFKLLFGNDFHKFRASISISSPTLSLKLLRTPLSFIPFF